MQIRQEAQVGVWEHLQSASESIQKKLQGMTFEEFCSLEQYALDKIDLDIVNRHFPGNKEAVQVHVARGIRIIYTDADAMVLVDREYYHTSR